ncbi:MAG: RNA polymerase sigma factor [Gemmatimonadota bacterium]|nr:RNA polymerase sigma factor [Gemmatimonadota bacterium]MDH5284486.1 RNA polymerase sigma factor [Gemmatimonadota bacterium]
MTAPVAQTDLPSDVDLIRAYRDGDEASAAVLVRRHTAALARFLGGAGADGADIEDLVQESFFRAFRSLGAWRGESAFRSWLFRIGSNLLKDQFRRRRGRVVIPLEDGDLVAGDDPGSALEAREARGRLEKGLGMLPRLQREVFLLRVQQGMPYEEIATVLDTTPGAARVHYHHAVKKLKDLVR